MGGHVLDGGGVVDNRLQPLRGDQVDVEGGGVGGDVSSQPGQGERRVVAFAYPVHRHGEHMFEYTCSRDRTQAKTPYPERDI